MLLVASDTTYSLLSSPFFSFLSFSFFSFFPLPLPPTHIAILPFSEREDRFRRLEGLFKFSLYHILLHKVG